MKQVFVVDAELMLPPGKLSAQVAHGAIAAFLSATNADQRAWLEMGMPKVVLQGTGGAQLELIAAEADAAGLPTALVRDAGRTVVAPGDMRSYRTRSIRSYRQVHRFAQAPSLMPGARSSSGPLCLVLAMASETCDQRFLDGAKPALKGA